MCVPVVKETPREAGNRGKHVHGGGVLKSREHHRPLEAVIRRNVVGSVGGGSRGVSTLRSVVVGATSGDVVPVPQPRGEALALAHAPIFDDLCPALASGLWVLTYPVVGTGAT